LIEILIDVWIIMLAIYVVTRVQELELFSARITAIGIGISGWVLGAVHGRPLLSVISLAALAVALIWMVCGAPLRHAAIGSVIFLACKTGLTFAVSRLFA
jgi:hypothetical protein